MMSVGRKDSELLRLLKNNMFLEKHVVLSGLGYLIAGVLLMHKVIVK